MENVLPSIPAKRYFTIGEVSELCGVKPYVLRYWEQEFVQLKPMKRRGNRRYYQHHEVLLIRRIRELLYEQGFTISGARNRLTEAGSKEHIQPTEFVDDFDDQVSQFPLATAALSVDGLTVTKSVAPVSMGNTSMDQLREELLSIRQMLSG